MKILSFATIGLILLTIWAPNAYSQQQEQEWKTYREPLHFSIDYPVFEGQTANITGNQSDFELQYVMISSQPVIITIFQTYWGKYLQYIDPQEQAVINKQNLLGNNTNLTMAQDIFTSVYDGNMGYTFLTYDQEFQTIESHTFVETGNYIYDIRILGMAYNPITVDNINRILESVKFFD